MRAERAGRQLKIRTTSLAVSLMLDEREDVQRAAWLSDQSVSAFIRDAAVKAAQRVLARAEKKAA